MDNFNYVLNTLTCSFSHYNLSLPEISQKQPNSTSHLDYDPNCPYQAIPLQPLAIQTQNQTL
jgi:hypothetical protein